MPSKVPFIRPRFPSAEQLQEDIAAITQNNWFSNFGPLEREFRSRLAEYVGGEVMAATVNNATTGLIAAIAALLPRGNNTRNIAIPSFTFAAGAHAIVWHGYRPLWFDIEEESLQPSLHSFRELLSGPHPLDAVLLTSTFGIGNSEIVEWEHLTSEIGIPLIIDSAAGFGSRLPNEELLGARGACEVFSFHATKPFGIGEGGAVFSRNSELIDEIVRFTNFGFEGGQGAASLGLNGKLQEINAAIGLRQLSEFESKLQMRQDLVQRYKNSLATLPLAVPRGLELSSASFLPAVFEDPRDAEAALEQLAAANVDARRYYAPPVHVQTAFRSFETTVSLAVTESVATRTVGLPVLADMSDEEFSRVASAVVSVFS